MKQANFFHSIKFKMIAGIMLCILIFFVLFIYNHFYMNTYLKEQLISAEKTISSLYMENIDSTLKSIDFTMLNTLTDFENKGFTVFTNSDTQVLAAIQIKNTLEQQILINEHLLFYFYYDAGSDEFIYSFATAFPSSAIAAVKDLIHNKASSWLSEALVPSQSGWQPATVNGYTYLCNTLSHNDKILGAIIGPERIFDKKNLLKYTNPSSIPVLVTKNGIPLNNQEVIRENNISLRWDFENYYISGTPESFLITGVPSLYKSFGLATLIPNHSGSLQPFYIHQLILLTFLLIFIYALILLFIIRRLVIRPVNMMLNATKAIAGGAHTLRLPTAQACTEFNMLSQSFNQMLDQIQALKIEFYERQIELQEAQIEQIRLQTNPHLLLNSLSLIYQLEKEKNPAAPEAAYSLIQCFRYMIREKSTLVPLQKEIEFFNNYKKILDLTYPGRIQFNTLVPAFLENIPVPTLTLQNFVENSVKYALRDKEPLVLSIETGLSESDGEGYLSIRISDNGPGFSSEVLWQLLAHKPVIDPSGRQHIGIINYIKRLKIIYKDNAFISFCNLKDGGACIQIQLPITPKIEEIK